MKSFRILLTSDVVLVEVEDEPSVDGELIVDEVLSEDSRSAIEKLPVEDPCPSDRGGPGGSPGGGPPAP